MAALRVRCLLFLLLVLNTAWLANAYAHEPAVDVVVYSYDEKEGIVERVADGNVASRREIGGRKLMVHNNKRIDIKGNGELEETLMARNNANNYEVDVKKSGYKGKKNKNKVVMKNGGSKRSASVSHFPRALSNEAGFVAFSADYHAPRHHPPKNN